MSKYGAIIKKAREESETDTTELSLGIPDQAQPIAHEASIEDIHLPEKQPRRYFNAAKMQELANSIKVEGILEPLIVRPLKTGGYELVAGERRLRAAKMAALREVPITVHNFNDTQARRVALVENLQREDLNPVEETEGIIRLLALELNITDRDVVPLLYRMQNEAKGKATHNVMGSHEASVVKEVFDKLQMTWESFVSNRLPVLKWPKEILKAVQEGKIAYTKASAIARVKDTSQQKKLLKTAISEDLSLSELKAKIKSTTGSNSNRTDTSASTLKSQIEQSLSRLRRSHVLKNPNPKKKKKLERLKALIEEILADDEANP